MTPFIRKTKNKTKEKKTKTKTEKNVVFLQGPAVKMIMEHKVEVIDCLRADHSFILQHVHARHIVRDRQQQNLMHSSLPEKNCC